MSATYAEHKKFVSIDKWEKLKSAKGKTGDHFRYRKVLANGDVLRTKVSHGTGQYGPDLWKKIWSKQLALETEDQFWEALKSGKPVVRPGDEEAEGSAPPGIPSELHWQLVHTAGIDEHTAARMTLDEAVQAMTRHWTGESGPRTTVLTL